MPTSGDKSDQEVVNKTVKKAAIKENTETQVAFRINIKHTKGQSQHSSYRFYNVRAKRSTREIP